MTGTQRQQILNPSQSPLDKGGSKGGFDVVIGNPPYVVLSKEGFDEMVIQYLGRSFKEVTYQLDSYLLFMAQAVRLSKNLVGYIVPNAYLGNLKIVDFRKWLLRNTSLKQIVLLPPDVFEGAVVDTTIIVFSTKFDPKNKIEVRGKNIFRYYHTDMDEYISYGDWLAEPRNIRFFNQPRIYVRKIVGETLYAAFSDAENIPDQSVYIGILRKGTSISLKYFLGILNSKLMVFIFRYMNNEFDTLFPQIKVTEFKQLPIRPIDFNNPSEKAVHDKLVSLVDRMLELHKRKASLPPSAEREKIEREIAITDEKIDDIVYGLYGITEEERGIIEEK